MTKPKLEECLPELLKFILDSHIKGTLETNLSLPLDFFSHLLNSTQQLALALHHQYPETFNTLNSVDFDLHVQEPFFTQIKNNMKTVEGRCHVGEYTKIGLGSLIMFSKCLIVEVKGVRVYDSFKGMLEAESLEKVLPGVGSIEEGVQVYRRFYSEETERCNGVVAICIEKLDGQVYNCVAKLLSDLGCEGIKSLL